MTRLTATSRLEKLRHKPAPATRLCHEHGLQKREIFERGTENDFAETRLLGGDGARDRELIGSSCAVTGSERDSNRHRSQPSRRSAEQWLNFGHRSTLKFRVLDSAGSRVVTVYCRIAPLPICLAQGKRVIILDAGATSSKCTLEMVFDLGHTIASNCSTQSSFSIRDPLYPSHHLLLSSCVYQDCAAQPDPSYQAKHTHTHMHPHLCTTTTSTSASLTQSMEASC